MDIAVHETGPADAPTLLFVHGGGISRWMWEPQLERLRDFHCLVPDLPGHGDSAGIPFESIADCAQRLVNVIKARAHGRAASVVGVSLGGQILVELMARYPGRVGRALLSGTLARPMQGGSLLRWGLRLYAPFRNWPVLVRANMRTQGIPETYYPQWAAETRRLDVANLQRVLAANMAYSPPVELADVAVPTLLLTGEREPEIMHRSAQTLVGQMRNARSGVVAGLGHAWNLEDPDLFAETVRAWMNQQPLSERIIKLTEPPAIEVPIGPLHPPVVEDDDDEWWEEP